MFQIALPRYEFVPDPTATFDIEGLKGNLPSIIAQGIAGDTFSPTSILLAFAAAKSEPQSPLSCDGELGSQIIAALREDSLSVGGTGCDSQGDTWRTLVYVQAAPDQRLAIDAAAAKVQQRFQGRVSSVSQRYVLSVGSPNAGVANAADAKARRQAQELAWLALAGDLRWMSNWAGPGEYSLTNPASGQPVPTDAAESLFDRFVLTDPSPPPLVRVKAVVQELYVGSTSVPAALKRTEESRASAAFVPPDSWYLPPLKKQATIAADRPELYAFGSASAKAALGSGLAPNFAAIAHARQRAVAISNVLGVRLGYDSLFALYPNEGGSDTRTIGLAATFSGAEPAKWEKFRSPSTIRVFRGQDLRQEAMLPISVPDDKTLITELAAAQTTVNSEILRLEVELESSAENAAYVDARPVVTRLRRYANVLKVAEIGHHDRGFQVRYEIELKGAGRDGTTAMVDFLQNAYRAARPTISVAVKPMAPNCGAIERKLLEATIHRNWTLAKDDARVSRRRIRKLLLFVVFPGDNQNMVCAPLAQEPGQLETGYPGPGSLMALTSMMVFRTFSEP